MNTAIARTLALLLLVGAIDLRAQVPQLINYQGRVAVGGVNFDGSGQFKFALVNAAGTTTYWSNDGTSTIGSQPTAAVTLTKGFWMGVHEVTQAEYQTVTGSNPSFFTGDTNRPVESVSWNEAVAYCAALTTAERTAGRLPAGWGYRLPTEAQWEYACRERQ